MVMKGGLVKICGLRDPENIRDVIQLKPDLIGLIFYPGSPRYISDLKSLAFLNEIQERPLTVGVFVNPEMEDIRKISKAVRLDVVQLHGSETPEMCRAIREEGHMVIKAFGIQPGFDFSFTEPYSLTANYFLFDTGGPVPGGSGKAFSWDILDLYRGETSFFLSGGISPETEIFPVHTGLAGVDLNSRFETEPGMKAIGLLKKFIKQFRNG